MGRRARGCRASRTGTLLLAALLSACAVPQGGAHSVTSDPRAAAEEPMTALGSYLAGQHAQQEHDYAAAARFYGEALAQDPDNYQLLNKTFLFRLTEGQNDEAVRLAERIDRIDATAPVPNLALTLSRLKAGDLAGAKARAQKLPVDGIHRFATPLVQAWIDAGLGNTDAAIAALKPLRDIKGFGVLAEFHEGLIDDFAGRTDAAEAAYQSVMKSGQTGNWRTIEALGSLYERTGRPEKARALYAGFAPNASDSDLVSTALARVKAGRKPAKPIATAADGAAEALFDLASALNDTETADLALVYGRLALLLKPDFPVAQLLVADILETERRPAVALAIDRSIPQQSPYSWPARLRAAGNLQALGRTDEAAAELQAMAAEHPDRVQPLVQLGDLWRSKNRFPEAVAAYDKAIARTKKIAPRDWTLFYSRGVARERAGDWPGAESDLLEALKLDPNEPLVLNYLGYSWVDKGIKLDEALRMIERAVELRPNDGYVVDSLGWAYYRLGKYGQATQKLERAIELRPEDPTINDHLGDAYWQVGRRAEARNQWRRALQFGPEADEAKTIEAKLDRGLAKPGPGGTTARGG